MVLSAVLKNLIKKGNFKEYIQKNSALEDLTRKRLQKESPSNSDSELQEKKLVDVIFDKGSVGESKSYTQEVISISTSKGKRKVEDESITFNSEDLEKVIAPHEDPLVIKADIVPTSTVTSSWWTLEAQWIYCT